MQRCRGKRGYIPCNRGAPGPTGPQGDPGPAGAAGPAGAPGAGFTSASVQTTNNTPFLLYSQTLAADAVLTLRATITARRVGTASIIGKFVREFTTRRVGGAAAVLVQDLAPSPDTKDDPTLDVTDTTFINNAQILVTGISGPIVWNATIEVTSNA